MSWIGSGPGALQISNDVSHEQLSLSVRKPGIAHQLITPGSDYVDWLGLSVYGQQYKDEPNPDIPFFFFLFGVGNLAPTRKSPDSIRTNRS